jgi:histidinol-phosphate aminotransferase
MEKRGVLVGRPFPPYPDWCRVSLGTVDEMKIFATALREVTRHSPS